MRNLLRSLILACALSAPGAAFAGGPGGDTAIDSQLAFDLQQRLRAIADGMTLDAGQSETVSDHNSEIRRALARGDYATAETSLIAIARLLSGLNPGHAELAEILATLTNEAPTIADLGDLTMNEDQPGGSGPVAIVVSDTHTAAGDLAVTITENSDPALCAASLANAGGNHSVTIVPPAEASGSCTLTIGVSDGALEASDAFTVTVVPVNDAPTLSAPPATDIQPASATEGASTGPLAFTVGDVETAAAALTVTATSSTPQCTATLGAVSGDGGTRNVTVTSLPVTADVSCNIGIAVSDGELTAESAFVVNVTAPPPPPPPAPPTPEPTPPATPEAEPTSAPTSVPGTRVTPESQPGGTEDNP